LAALGASYGGELDIDLLYFVRSWVESGHLGCTGYMVNWLQGHNEHTKFKAFVCHDGLFGMYTFHSTHSAQEVDIDLLRPSRDPHDVLRYG
jgi:hypothetical protein